MRPKVLQFEGGNMTLEETNLTVEQVQSVRDRSFKDAYEIHDIGYEIIVARLEAHGFHVEDHGDDARDVDEIYLGDGPDLAIYESESGSLVAYIEVKCKQDEEWFGRCNLRHYREYVNFSNEVNVPVFVWFALLDEDTNVIHRDAFHEVTDMGQLDGDVMDVTGDEIVFYEDDVRVVNDDGLVAVDGDDILDTDRGDVITMYIPDVWGNEVVELDSKTFRGFPHFLHRVQHDESVSVGRESAHSTCEDVSVSDDSAVSSLTEIASAAR
jgi:hypothetical protein